MAGAPGQKSLYIAVADPDAGPQCEATDQQLEPMFQQRRLFGAGVLLSTVVFLSFLLFGSFDSGAGHAGVRGSVGLSSVGVFSRAKALEIAERARSASVGKLSSTAVANMNDGNRCADDEEEFDGLCYAKCAILTSGEQPVRKSGWTCCKEAAQCKGFMKFVHCCKTKVGMCSGFSVAGLREGDEVCPHVYGGCLQDEELHLGLCYMKCSILTGGMYPFRVNAEACCKTKGLGCFAEEGAKDGIDGYRIVNKTFAIGGGCGDKTRGTPCKPHPPLRETTESAKSLQG